VLDLVWRTGRLPSEILGEEEYWIDLMLLDLDAQARARKK
jgi:hypothetical protein